MRSHLWSFVFLSACIVSIPANKLLSIFLSFTLVSHLSQIFMNELRKKFGAKLFNTNNFLNGYKCFNRNSLEKSKNAKNAVEKCKHFLSQLEKNGASIKTIHTSFWGHANDDDVDYYSMAVA